MNHKDFSDATFSPDLAQKLKKEESAHKWTTCDLNRANDELRRWKPKVTIAHNHADFEQITACVKVDMQLHRLYGDQVVIKVAQQLMGLLRTKCR